MAEVMLRNGRRVGDFERPYIVAELNTSHFGDIEIAKNMIRSAKDAGCDCVKFQSWTSETLYCESYYKANPIAKRFVNKFALTNDQMKMLSLYAKEVDIDFASTPYSIEEAEFLVRECDVPFIKIASMELNNLPYLKSLASIGVPLVLSTGMGAIDEITLAVKTIEEVGNRSLVILHCTSVYPAAPELIRLQNITGLRLEFPKFPIGYSDHSIGVSIPAASVALGACLIEKHFTLDSSRIGMDNQMATEPKQMEEMVLACSNVFRAMGGAARVLSEDEQAQIPMMRRSMVARKKLGVGDVLSENCIEFKRPGNGISPAAYSEYLGRKLIKDIEVGSVLFPQDFS